MRPIFPLSQYSELDKSNKLDTLKLVEKIFCFEKYISCIDIEKHRIAISRFSVLHVNL